MIIVGIGICGPDEAKRNMRKTLEEFKRLCDKVVIVTNNVTKNEIDLIEEYGFEHYEDNREWGIHQPSIKTDLLTYVGKYNPDWIIPLDMDEVFAPEFTREEAERLASKKEIAYNFMIVNLYNDDEHFAHDVGIQRFWNIRFFKFMPEYGLQFQKKNLHCGWAPPVMYKYGWHAPYYILHRGLQKPEDRVRKAQRYDKYDPSSKFKSKLYYDDLRKELKMFKFDSKGLLAKLKESVDCKDRIMPKLKQ